MTENKLHPPEHPLESWKEIAAYLKRDVRTVIRWEKSEGLPIHRQMHQARGNVFAYPSELEAWKGSRAAEGIRGGVAHGDIGSGREESELRSFAQSRGLRG